MSLGQLWLELLRFYTLEFALEDYIISIRLKELLSREVKNWPRRRLAIEGKKPSWRILLCLERLKQFTPFFYFSKDPFALKRNVARSLNSQMVFEYIQERFRSAYKYFACPQWGSQRGRKGREGAERNEGQEEKPQSPQKVCEEHESEDEEGSDPSRKSNEKTLDASLMDMDLSERNKMSVSPNGLLDSDREGEDGQEEDLRYVFDRMIFTGGKVTVNILYCCLPCRHRWVQLG